MPRFIDTINFHQIGAALNANIVGLYRVLCLMVFPTAGYRIIDARQGDVIKRILTSIGEWTEEEAPVCMPGRRAPPGNDVQRDLELPYLPCGKAGEPIVDE
jgi:hypothetical protein